LQHIDRFALSSDSDLDLPHARCFCVAFFMAGMLSETPVKSIGLTSGRQLANESEGNRV
jgi:hypothetical protein